ncbi:MAG: TrbC/VirB2 family protein [Clostridia bacterium]|nr:TrbC/VirB2 family protein [Clostridia bacterium]
MKKSVKIISMLVIVTMIVTISTTCFAGGTVGGVSIPAGTPGDTTTLAQKAANVVATLRNIAAIAAVVIIAILGIKYMLGSVEEKAEYKKSFMPLIVGIIVVTLALQIAAMIFNVAG